MKKVKDLKGNDIELWAEGVNNIFSQSLRELTNQEALDLVSVCLSEEYLEKDVEFADKLDKGKLGLSSLLWKRVKYCHSFQISKALALYLGLILESPGNVVIITNYIQWKAFKANTNKVDMEFFSRSIFPWEFQQRKRFRKFGICRKLRGRKVLWNLIIF